MNQESIKKALNFLKNGDLICFPTETVYGLGADATNDSAILKIYSIKNRPIFNPLIIHTYSIEMAEKIAFFNEDARKLSILWPGPITLVMKKRNNIISNKATNSLKTIAIRIPSGQIAQNILKSFTGYIAAPSANPSGYISSTKFEHVVEHYKDCRDIFIINGTDCVYGIESTIIDVSNNEPTILRHGFIEQETIENILGKPISSISKNIIAPGMLDKHYSPHSRIRLNANSLEDEEIGIGFDEVLDNFELNLSKSGDLKEAAANLYDLLRKADQLALRSKKTIAVSPIPNKNIGIAINDKLIRAAK